MNRTIQRYSTIALAGGFLALAAVAAGAGAAIAYRLDVLPLRDAFNLLRWAAWGGAGAGALCLAGLVHARPGATRRGFVTALAGLAAGASVFWIPFSQQRLAQSVPAIHDITTDTGDPPQFEALLQRRPQHANSLVYGGEELARKQRAAYPGIRPATFQAPPGEVFEAALETAQDLGWRVVASDRREGRIEAVAATFWFGFRDDVVVRVAGGDGATRVDVRSVSRVGVSDVGKNAERIARFLEALAARL